MSGHSSRKEQMSEGDAFGFIAISYVMMLRGELKRWQIEKLNDLPNDRPTGNNWIQHVEKQLEITTQEQKDEIANMPPEVDSHEVLDWLMDGSPPDENPGTTAPSGFVLRAEPDAIKVVNDCHHRISVVPNAPAGPPMPETGDKVRIKGLVSAAQHNDKVGTVVNAAAPEGRVAVRLHDDDDTKLAVKLANLYIVKRKKERPMVLYFECDDGEKQMDPLGPSSAVLGRRAAIEDALTSRGFQRIASSGMQSSFRDGDLKTFGQVIVEAARKSGVGIYGIFRMEDPGLGLSFHHPTLLEDIKTGRAEGYRLPKDVIPKNEIEKRMV